MSTISFTRCFSFSYGDPYSTTQPKVRKHIWTYAVGNSEGFASNVKPNSAATITEADYAKFKEVFPWYDPLPGLACANGTCTLPGLRFGPIPPYPNGTKSPARLFQDLVVYANCWRSPDIKSIEICYVGNCECHGGAELQTRLYNPPNEAGLRFDAKDTEREFGPPAFLGDGDYYCDGSAGAVDQFWCVVKTIQIQ